MNQEFDIDEFEELLRTQTDKHRMYPDDAVWRNINNQLHEQHRWPALTFSAILTVAVLTAGFIFLHPKKDLFNHSDFADNNVGKSVNIVTKKHKIHTNNFNRGLKPTDEKSVIYSLNSMVSQADDNTVMEMEGNFDMPVYNNIVVSLNEPVNDQASSSIQVKNIVVEKLFVPKLDSNVPKNVVARMADKQILQAFSIQKYLAVNEDTVQIEPDANEKKESAIKENNQTDKNIPVTAVKKQKEQIENPWEMSFYATPSISYRTLSLDQSFDSHYPYNSALSGNPRNDVNSFVNQHPAIGLELGSSISYAISNKFKVKAGLQFNYRQYNLDAFVTPTQQTSLLLNRGNYADSMVAFSNISTQGVNAVTIANYYYQFSVPIGFEYTAIQGRKFDVLFGATLQPTIQFNKNMYIVSSDYKAYTMEPSLARRWNINTGVELLARFKAAGVQWQMGPQIRYQMLPTQINSYIIHEHLVDYGLKLGIVKQLK